MSRSYRKNMWIKDNNSARGKLKRLANKRVRQMDDVADGMDYKKYYNSYDICDYKFSCTFEEFLSWGWVRAKFGDDRKAARAEWERMCKSK